jgi:hypothetical protein
MSMISCCTCLSGWLILARKYLSYETVVSRMHCRYAVYLDFVLRSSRHHNISCGPGACFQGFARHKLVLLADERDGVRHAEILMSISPIYAQHETRTALFSR